MKNEIFLLTLFISISLFQKLLTTVVLFCIPAVMSLLNIFQYILNISVSIRLDKCNRFSFYLNLCK